MPKIFANGIEVYFEAHGEGEPLLFIHGLGSSTRDWEYQVEPFSRSFRVITYDLRGHGQSEKPEGPYTVPLFATDASALLAALDVRLAHVVGVSLGGGVAFQLALDHPELVKTLTIVNSSPMLPGTQEQIDAEMERRVGIVRQMGMRAMGEALASNLFPEPGQEGLRLAFIERWAENDPRAYVDATLSLAHWNVLDQIHKIQCPVLVIAADQDYSPVALKESYTRLMPHAELVIVPGARHALPMEKPAEFSAVLGGFLARNN